MLQTLQRPIAQVIGELSSLGGIIPIAYSSQPESGRTAGVPAFDSRGRFLERDWYSLLYWDGPGASPVPIGRVRRNGEATQVLLPGEFKCYEGTQKGIKTVMDYLASVTESPPSDEPEDFPGHS